MKRACLLLPWLLCCTSLLHGQTQEQRKETITYLQSLQTSEGGFLPQAAKGNEVKPTVRATSSALRALKYFGGEAKDPASCGQFVHSCFNRTAGGFADSPGGTPTVATTAIGIMAVVEVKLPADTYTPSVVKFLGENTKEFEEIRIAAAGLEAINQRPPQAATWIEQILKMRNAEGSFGKGIGQARDTGGSLVALLRLGYKPEKIEGWLAVLKAGQRKDGGFGKEDSDSSDLETTYRVMRAFHMLKERPAEPEKLRAFLAKCRNTDGGYGVAADQPSNVSATYYAAIIRHWLAEQ